LIQRKLTIPEQARGPVVTEDAPCRLGFVIGQMTRGGAEGQLAHVVQQLPRERYEPLVYCLSAATEPIGTVVAASGVVVRSVVGSAVHRIRQLAWHLAEDRIDVVHSWLYLANAALAGARLTARVPPMITSARNCKVQSSVNWLANVLAFRCSRAIVANSQDVATYIVRHYGAPRARIRVIPNAIDVERFHPAAERNGVGPIVTAGRLVTQKNHALFLRAAAQLAREMPEVRFVIVGDGPLRPMLEREALAAGIADRVRFAGERGDVEAILRTASLFWLTSRWEGMPNVVLEAMASGVPVVATDVGGTREIIRSGRDGFIVPADGSAFVSHSRTLLSDVSLRQRMAAAARERAEEFSVRRMVEALAQVYDVTAGRAP
jgi:glycosyltransferase involved in cell wall biosynthesis